MTRKKIGQERQCPGEEISGQGPKGDTRTATFRVSSAT